MQVIACIEEPVVIEKIVNHLGAKATKANATRRGVPVLGAATVRFV